MAPSSSSSLTTNTAFVPSLVPSTTSFFRSKSTSSSSSSSSTLFSSNRYTKSRRATVRAVAAAPPAIRVLRDEADLKHNLQRRGRDEVTVVKCAASYCAGCRGAAPKYRKVAAAYGDAGAAVSFCEFDYAANEHFCRSVLGVAHLPFFAVFRGKELISAQPIAWQSVATTLVDNIENAINQQN